MDWCIYVTETRMNRLALGTVQFGLPYGVANQTGQVDEATAITMLDLAATAGINTLDTAIAYGSSETTLGRIGVQSLNIITKLPPTKEGEKLEKVWVRGNLQKSLLRLQVSQVHGLLLHRSELLLEPAGLILYEALQELKDEGLVKKIGISAYSPDEVTKVTKHYKLDLIQIPFNLLDQRLLQSGCLDKLKREGIEVHVRSAFLQGLLLMKKQHRPEKFSKWSAIWTQWHDWLDSNEASALRACLSYPLAFPEIDRIVVGVDSVLQLQEIIEAANHPIPLADLPNLVCHDEALINPSHWSQL